MVTSLARREEAFQPDELVDWVRRRIGTDLLDVVDQPETRIFVVTPSAWVQVATALKEEPRLAFTMFDTLFGVDVGEAGFDVLAILYSVETGQRVILQTRVPGGRDEPSLPTLTGVFRGADWHERETWDMFGIEFGDHPGLAPRILCAENFEGWPLRKDFHLATREAKPWPGIKEPAELDEDGNVIEKIPGIGEAVGPMPLDELMAEQARAANPHLVTDDDEDGEDAAELEVEVAREVATKPADDVRAEAAEARAARAEEIAADGPVGGDGSPSIPAGDPDAFKDMGQSTGPVTAADVEHRTEPQADDVDDEGTDS